MYTEDPFAAAPCRRRLIQETDAYIQGLCAEAEARRNQYFTPDISSPEAYTASLEPYRADLIHMLGRPLTDTHPDIPTAYERTLLAEDGLGTVERLWVEVLPGLSSYGLLFVPKGEGPHPYVTALHGGGGTCEIVSTLYDTGSANYTDLVQRIRQKTNAIVYAPQLLLWFDSYNTDDCEKSDNIGHNDRLRQVGGSVAALEITKVMRTVDWICANLPVDTDRMGIAGLSYGGFYTLMTAAVDTRYRAALSSCFFSDRLKHAWGDWVWLDSASKFLDPEIASLVCPRALCIESGAADPLFAIDDTVRTVGAVAKRYAALGIADRFRFHIHPGDHEFNRGDENLDWFAARLLNL